MDKKLHCRDIGLDCDSVVCGNTDEEVVTKAGQHVLATHGIEGFSKEFYNKARAAVREGHCDDKDAREMTPEESSSSEEAYLDCADECCC